MATQVKYRIVVPSRHRAANMPRILALLPTAVVTVDVDEAAAYGEVVPASRLILHQPAETMAQLRQCILDTMEEECIVMIDDDLRCIRALVGRRTRKITDPGAILQIIENGINIAVDLGMHLFGWQRNANPLQFYAYDPLSLVAPVTAAWGVVGRDHRMDLRLTHGEDLDLTLTNLLENRVVLHDRRFYFDCGPRWKGEGGLQGIRTAARAQADSEILKEKWGQYISTDRQLKSGGTGMAVRVQRRCTLAAGK